MREKLSENIEKPKRAWENYKKIKLTRQKGSNNKHMPRYEKRVDVSPRTIANTFKKHFANLASDLVKKLPDPTGKFGIPLVRQYYKEINFREKKLKFEKVSSVSILKILKEFKANKTTGADNLARSFLKDGPNTLYTL